MQCTAKVKALADLRVLTLDDADSVIRNVSQNARGGTRSGLDSNPFQFHRDLHHPPSTDGILNGALAEPTSKNLNGSYNEANSENPVSA